MTTNTNSLLFFYINCEMFIIYNTYYVVFKYNNQEVNNVLNIAGKNVQRKKVK